MSGKHPVHYAHFLHGVPRWNGCAPRFRDHARTEVGPGFRYAVEIAEGLHFFSQSIPCSAERVSRASVDDSMRKHHDEVFEAIIASVNRTKFWFTFLRRSRTVTVIAGHGVRLN